MDLGHSQGNTYDKFKQQKLMDPGQQNDYETKRQKEREKSLPDSDSDISEQQSNIGNMTNTFLESARETEYVQNLTDSMQNLFPRNFQSLTGTAFRDNGSPQKSQNSRRSLSAPRTSGPVLCAQNELVQEDSSPTRSNDSACKNGRNQKSESDSVNFPSNSDSFENIRRPTFRRNLLGQGQSEDSLTPGSQRFSLHDQYKYVQTPTSGRVLHRQEQCDDTLGPGSHNFLSPHEQWRDSKSPGSWSYNNCGIGESMQSHQEQKVPFPGTKKEKKEKKSITTKTFAHGMMDVSLLTSNATQLRAVLSNPSYEFYTLLLWLIGLSIVLQLLSAVLLISSDFLKTQVKEKDRKNQGKRKFLNFLSLTLVTIVMSLNVLISAFSSPTTFQQHVPSGEVRRDIPAFSSPDIQTARSEL
ncbi:uncharacterized protein LOC132730117 [Ruditapes philippinarum]|uniref:uncharacterized protein LOC132730117 n=1 Tax=Ruditapes philippinarum TaxID=129788 RepID=UPI00295B43FE|nr:uncharacterized protein LOC132730117 [Ruditapes philippinarum]